jgi:methyl-accepting chemotaxis protein
MLSRLSIKGQFALLLAIVTVCFLIFGAGERSARESIRIGGPTYADIIRGKDLVADVLPPPNFIIESHLTALQLLNATAVEDQRRLVDHMKHLRGEYDERIAYWQKEPLNDDLKRAFLTDAHGAAVRYYDIAFNRYLPAVQSGDGARMRALVPELQSSFDTHRRAVDRVVILANEENVRIEKNADEHLQTATWLLWGMLIGSVLLAALLAWPISHGLESGITVAENALGKLADGNLRDPVPLAGSSRELADMLGSLERMRGQWHKMIETLSEDAERLKHESESMASAASQISAALRDQGSATENISGSVGTLSATISHISESAKRSAGLARDAGEVVVHGADAVGRMARDSEELAEQVAQSSATVDELGTRSQEISAVVGVIREIADQTNLLALNAAIEAARAGEQGRGFAVVADEVRKLAERTAQSTTQITKIIDAVQTQTAQAVSVMRIGADKARAGVAAVDEVSRQIRDVVGRTESLVAEITSISADLEQQTATGVAVTDGVARIAAVTEENSAAIASTVEASRDVHAVAADLQASIRRFSI